MPESFAQAGTTAVASEYPLFNYDGKGHGLVPQALEGRRLIAFTGVQVRALRGNVCCRITKQLVKKAALFVERCRTVFGPRPDHD